MTSYCRPHTLFSFTSVNPCDGGCFYWNGPSTFIWIWLHIGYHRWRRGKITNTVERKEKEKRRRAILQSPPLRAASFRFPTLVHHPLHAVHGVYSLFFFSRSLLSGCLVTDGDAKAERSTHNQRDIEPFLFFPPSIVLNVVLLDILYIPPLCTRI